MDARIQRVLSGVTDPEIPVLLVLDLGVLRRVQANGAEVEVDVSPT